MLEWLTVALGGALGSMARHGTNALISRSGFPSHYATMLVNVVGCGVIGTLAGLIAGGRVSLSPALRLFVFVGILGGFTTFSAFGLDSFTLWRGGRYVDAFWGVAVHIIAGLAAVAVGYAAALRV